MGAADLELVSGGGFLWLMTVLASSLAAPPSQHLVLGGSLLCLGKDLVVINLGRLQALKSLGGWQIQPDVAQGLAHVHIRSGRDQARQRA